MSNTYDPTRRFWIIIDRPLTTQEGSHNDTLTNQTILTFNSQDNADDTYQDYVQHFQRITRLQDVSHIVTLIDTILPEHNHTNVPQQVQLEQIEQRIQEYYNNHSNNSTNSNYYQSHQQDEDFILVLPFNQEDYYNDDDVSTVTDDEISILNNIF